MSIVLGETVQGIVTTSPTTQPAEPMWFNVFVVGWVLVALFFAKLLGAFRRRSIVGPPRMAEGESAWFLVFILLTGVFISATITNALGRFVSAPAELKQLTQSGILEALAFCFVVGAAVFFRPSGLALLGLRPIQIPRGVALGATTIFILFPLVLVVGQLTELALRLAGLPAPPAHEVLQALSENHDKRFVAIAVILVVIVAPMFEELAFRGCLQTTIARFFHWYESHDQPEKLTSSPSARSRWIATTITAGLFAAVHHELGFFPPLFVLAIGLGYLYERTGNLCATIAAHALFNAVQLLLFMGLS
jgi:membrane protease YdiL (CAAX protease family)